MAKRLTAPGKEALVKKLIEWFKKEECIAEIVFFYNFKKVAFKNGTDEPVVTEDIKASDYDEYANDYGITILFEGSGFYEMYNGDYGWNARNRFDEFTSKILKPYGMYFECDHSWALTTRD